MHPSGRSGKHSPQADETPPSNSTRARASTKNSKRLLGRQLQDIQSTFDDPSPRPKAARSTRGASTVAKSATVGPQQRDSPPKKNGHIAISTAEAAQPSGAAQATDTFDQAKSTQSSRRAQANNTSSHTKSAQSPYPALTTHTFEQTESAQPPYSTQAANTFDVQFAIQMKKTELAHRGFLLAVQNFTALDSSDEYGVPVDRVADATGLIRAGQANSRNYTSVSPNTLDHKPTTTMAGAPPPLSLAMQQPAGTKPGGSAATSTHDTVSTTLGSKARKAKIDTVETPSEAASAFGADWGVHTTHEHAPTHSNTTTNSRKRRSMEEETGPEKKPRKKSELVPIAEASENLL